MRNRIQGIIQYYGMTAARFAEEIDVQRSGISHILNGRNQPSYDLILKILKRFPEIDAEWLILGSGNMFKPGTRQNDQVTTLRREDIQHASSGNDVPPDFIDDIQPDKQAIVTKVTNVTSPDQILLLYPDGTFKAYGPARE